jgi:hypothetical protein
LNFEETFLTLQIKKAFVVMLIGALLLCLAATIEQNLASAEVNSEYSSTFWLTLSNNAWNYFQPGVGVDASTGLAQGAMGSRGFTDWDLGLYIQAIGVPEKSTLYLVGRLRPKRLHYVKCPAFLHQRLLECRALNPNQ